MIIAKSSFEMNMQFIQFMNFYETQMCVNLTNFLMNNYEQIITFLDIDTKPLIKSENITLDYEHVSLYSLHLFTEVLYFFLFYKKR